MLIGVEILLTLFGESTPTFENSAYVVGIVEPRGHSYSYFRDLSEAGVFSE